VSAAGQQRWGSVHLSTAINADVTGIHEGSDAFAREMLFISAGVTGVLPLPVVGSVTRLHSGAADPFEQASYGGAPSPLLDRTLLRQRLSMPVLPTGIGTAADVVAYRVAIPVSRVAPYLWTAKGPGCTRGGARCMSWNRVIGVEGTFTMPAIPYAGTPPVRAQLGIGRSLDAPFRHQVRGYASVTIDP
jgi:hypothetical protein